MNIYPLILRPVLRRMPWGGNRLLSLDAPVNGEDVTDHAGEAWIMTCRPGADSVIANGIFTGKKLSEFLKSYPDAVGSSQKEDVFPLFIKLIDSEDDLSVQLHPDDEFALRYEGEHGKSEIWYIIDAKPDAKLISGLSRGGIDRIFNDSADGGRAFFREAAPSPGDVYYIPPGLVHSIGKGLLIAEIQQNSDLTYRISDFGRLWNGKPRELHVDKARKCVKDYSEGDITSLRFPHGIPSDGSVLCDNAVFRIIKLSPYADNAVRFVVGSDRFAALTVVAAEDGAYLRSCGTEFAISFGSSVFLPAGTGPVEVGGDCVCLLTYPGSHEE